MISPGRFRSPVFSITADVVRPAALLLALILVLGVSQSPAQTTNGVSLRANDAGTLDSSTTAAENALRQTPWYDPESDSLRPVKLKSTQDDSANRDSRWLPQAQRVPANNRSGSSAGGGGSGGLFGTGLSFGNLLGWGLLVAIVLAVVALLVYAFSKAEIDFSSGRRRDSDLLEGTPDEQTIERMKHLPAELRRTDVNLRSEALRLISVGEYDQAIILLFGHQLLLLDRAGLMRLSRGKTNGRYVRETRAGDPDLGTRLAATVQAFERSYFGKHPLAEAEMQSLWQSNERLEQSLQQRREAAA